MLKIHRNVDLHMVGLCLLLCVINGSLPLVSVPLLEMGREHM